MHDSTETTEDSFTLSASIYEIERRSLPVTISVTVIPVNDEPPKLTRNTGLEVSFALGKCFCCYFLSEHLTINGMKMLLCDTLCACKNVNFVCFSDTSFSSVYFNLWGVKLNKTICFLFSFCEKGKKLVTFRNGWNEFCFSIIKRWSYGKNNLLFCKFLSAPLFNLLCAFLCAYIYFLLELLKVLLVIDRLWAWMVWFPK